MVAHTAVLMQVPSTPLTWHVGGGVPELVLELLDVEVAPLLELLDAEPPTVRAWSAARSPSNRSASHAPEDPGTPGTVNVALYCQNGQAVNGAGTSGQLTPQFAIHSCAWFSRPAGLPSEPVTKLGEV